MASFLLPFTLFSGIALQISGVLLLGIILPLFYLKKSLPEAGRKIGFFLILLWALFPLTNIISFFQHPEFQEGIKFSDFFKSQVSSTWVLSGVFLLLSSSMILNKTSSCPTTLKGRSRLRELASGWASFDQGVLYASIFFSIYFLSQHFFGIDLRHGFSFDSINILPDHERMSSTIGYRVAGFYGHPLSLAGVALTWIGFYGYRYFSETASQQKKHFLIILLFQFLFLFLSGGRTAIISGIMIYLFLIFKFKKFDPKHMLFIFTFFVFLLYYTGIIFRFDEAVQQMEANHLNKIGRLTFWQVHWQMFLDSPLFGESYMMLSKGLREDYYIRLGFEDFYEKYNAHNFYLECLAEIGLLGSAVMLFILKKIKTCLPSSPLKNAFLFSFLGNILHGLTQNVFFDANVLAIYAGIFWVFIFTDNTRSCVLSINMKISRLLSD